MKLFTYKEVMGRRSNHTMLTALSVCMLIIRTDQASAMPAFYPSETESAAIAEEGRAEPAVSLYDTPENLLGLPPQFYDPVYADEPLTSSAPFEVAYTPEPTSSLPDFTNEGPHSTPPLLTATDPEPGESELEELQIWDEEVQEYSLDPLPFATLALQTPDMFVATASSTLAFKEVEPVTLAVVLQKLSNNDFDIREEGTRQISQLAPTEFEEFATALHSHSDIEVRKRLGRGLMAHAGYLQKFRQSSQSTLQLSLAHVSPEVVDIAFAELLKPRFRQYYLRYGVNLYNRAVAIARDSKVVTNPELTPDGLGALSAAASALSTELTERLRLVVMGHSELHLQFLRNARIAEIDRLRETEKATRLKAAFQGPLLQPYRLSASVLANAAKDWATDVNNPSPEKAVAVLKLLTTNFPGLLIAPGPVLDNARAAVKAAKPWAMNQSPDAEKLVEIWGNLIGWEGIRE